MYQICSFVTSLDFYSYEETIAAQKARADQPEPAHTSIPPFNQDYQFITTTAGLETAVNEIMSCPVQGIDTETTGLDPHVDRLRLVQIATPDFPTLVIDLWQISDTTALQKLLQNPARKVLHNLKFDWQFLHQAGLALSGPYFDIQLAYKVWRCGVKGKSSLAVVAKHLLGVELDKSQQISDFSKPNLSEEQIRYSAWDAAVLLPVEAQLRQRLRRRSQQWGARLQAIARLESACALATAWMELNGMGFDPERLKEALTEYRTERQQALQSFQSALGESQPYQPALFASAGEDKIWGTNPGSSPQVIRALGQQGVKLTSTNQRSVIKVVDKHPALPHLLEWRRAARLVDQIEGLPQHQHPQTRRLHPSIFQIGARSGRFSCRHPALQTMPHDPRVRRCFVAAPGFVLIKADYSQIELRIIARMTRDPLLVNAYCTNQDVHRLTASLLMSKPIQAVTKEERTIAKSINFGLIYGMSAVRLQLETQLKYGVMLTHAQALAFHKRFFVLFQGVAQWHRRVKRSLYQDQQRYAKTLLGRVRQWKETPGFNEFINFPVQGTSVDLTKLALVELLPHLNPDLRLIMMVHDEIVLEVREAIASDAARLLTRCMVDTATPILAPIPVEVDVAIGHSWSGE